MEKKVPRKAPPAIPRRKSSSLTHLYRAKAAPPAAIMPTTIEIQNPATVVYKLKMELAMKMMLKAVMAPMTQIVG